jgi:hypothetical protein
MQDYLKCKPTSATDSPAFNHIQSHKYSRAEKRLGLSRKAASKTSQEAYHPRNLEKIRRYWEDAYPNGVAGEMTDEMIDIDKAKFKLSLQTANMAKLQESSAAIFEASIKRESQDLISSWQSLATATILTLFTYNTLRVVLIFGGFILS